MLDVIPSSGDESAIRRAELLRKYILPHKNLIYSICIKYTFNQEDVEDNYQEALINFFKYTTGTETGCFRTRTSMSAG